MPDVDPVIEIVYEREVNTVQEGLNAGYQHYPLYS